MALPGTAVAGPGVWHLTGMFWHLSSRLWRWRPSSELQVLSLLTIQEMVEVSLLIPEELMNLQPAVKKKSDFKVWGSIQHGSLVQTERASLGNCGL